MTDASRPSRRTGEGGTEAGAPPGYEFSEANKDSFRALAQSMSFVGVWSLLLGGLGSALFGIVAFAEGFIASGLGALGATALCLPAAWWTMSAGRSLGALVRTQGRDVERLMEAVGHLRLLFAFARVVILLVTLAAVLVTAGVLWCMLVGGAGGKCFGAIG
jgi:hypothetical protein